MDSQNRAAQRLRSFLSLPSSLPTALRVSLPQHAEATRDPTILSCAYYTSSVKHNPTGPTVKARRNYSRSFIDQSEELLSEAKFHGGTSESEEQCRTAFPVND